MVGELVQQLLQIEDKQRFERNVKLLAKLSEHSVSKMVQICVNPFLPSMVLARFRLSISGQQRPGIAISKGCFQTLVHSMLGEHMNSSCWKDRFTMCKVLSRLPGQMGQVNVLSSLADHISWTDIVVE